MNLLALKTELCDAVSKAADLKTLDDVRITALGKKGKITELMKTLGALSVEERKSFGAELNVLKDEITTLIERQEEALKSQAMHDKLANEYVDITLPIRTDQKGSLHPITQTIDEMVSIFADMGFVVAEGPDIEDDFHNFTALNFPEGHPAREMHDTFYLPEGANGEKKLLRTHTSTVQVRAMIEQKAPLKIVCFGRTYRSDSDMTHTPMFHQFECLWIDTDVNMGHLKSCLMNFVREFFEIQDLPVRFRPSFFPFTEPSAEMDIGCRRESGKLQLGHAQGGSDKWMEVLGCGMVHPNVIKNCGLDPEKYQGFAAGLGIDRFAMLKYGIPDLRTFFESDTRWLTHYGFDPLNRPNRAYK